MLSPRWQEPAIPPTTRLAHNTANLGQNPSHP
jgi:hypothetical protein